MGLTGRASAGLGVSGVLFRTCAPLMYLKASFHDGARFKTLS